MNILDWVLVVVACVYALSGYWQGFVTGAFATVGLLAGGFFGVWLAPVVLGDAEPSLWVSLGALLIVILSASIGQGLLQWAGAKIRDRITWQPVRALDAVGGAALSAAAVLLVAWVLGVAVSGSKLSTVTPAVRSSLVLAKLDQLLPDRVTSALNGFNNVVGSSFFPRYLEPFAPERIVAVPEGDPRTLNDPEVKAAEASTFKVYGANECGRGVEGTGFLYAPGRLMTNAHVVAGVDEPEVEIDGDRVEAKVVLYDADLDVAVLALSARGIPTLDFADGVKDKEPVAILGYPQDGPYNVQSGRVRATQRLRSPDIYGDGTVIREVLSLRALVRPGNSGGPVVDTDGDVVGMVFAASVTDSQTGYALTAQQVQESAAIGLTAKAAVDTGPCAG
ncbi:MarP family serine protease [Nocardioides jishulii]|uniref:MarP family serine protease n=1 Tax=Nocardioides jishulii TaxID=2575440 RepID=A0A4U2YTE1_9ACTN|nr:MarP family serine protease [Nocardioides jishulii]QCX28819.1 MarP family serine protease [Nocardioides jishulii]TKI64284.1 MarP family serine protease [Nocardioides jishulii]